MKVKIVIEISNEYEAARLLTLIEDGKQVLSKQGRTQKGIDGYTDSDLERWHRAISKVTNARCEFANGKI